MTAVVIFLPSTVKVLSKYPLSVCYRNLVHRFASNIQASPIPVLESLTSCSRSRSSLGFPDANEQSEHDR
jgi:hypothetical protein